MERLAATSYDRLISMIELPSHLSAERRDDLDAELYDDAVRSIMTQPDVPTYRPVPGRPRSGVVAE